MTDGLYLCIGDQNFIIHPLYVKLDALNPNLLSDFQPEVDMADYSILH